MELNDTRLRVLFEAHRCGSMRAASEAMDVAPSSVSRQIAALEEEVGIAVIVKGRHSVRLTEAGEALLAYYSDRRVQLESVKAELEDLRSMRTGHVRIGIGQNLVDPLLTQAIQRYREELPGIRIHLTEMPSSEVVSHLARDEFHFGVLLNPPLDPMVRHRFTCEQAMSAVMLKSHALACMPSVSLAELVKHPMVLPAPNFRSRQVFDAICGKEGLVVDPVVTVTSVHMLVSCIRAGIGIGLAPQRYLAEHECGDLGSVPVGGNALGSMNVVVATRVGRRLPGSAEVLLRLFIRALMA